MFLLYHTHSGIFSICHHTIACYLSIFLAIVANIYFLDTVDYLFNKSLRLKTDINTGNNDNRTCLHIAALTNNMPLCKLLVEKYGADKTLKMKSGVCFNQSWKSIYHVYLLIHFLSSHMISVFWRLTDVKELLYKYLVHINVRHHVQCMNSVCVCVCVC